MFASCWVKNDTEEVFQWREYGSNCRGVRISVVEDPFDWSLIHGKYNFPGTQATWEFDQVWAPYPAEEIFGDGYLITPMPDQRHNFLREVIYVPDVLSEYNKVVSEFNGIITIQGDGTRLAQIKWDKWRYQKECRFVLLATWGPRKTNSIKEYGQRFLAKVKSGEWAFSGTESKNIDLRISDSAMQKIVVTAGPLCTDQDISEIKGIISEFNPTATLKPSSLTGLIRK